ncbi:indolepyruvate ferredoxin oxidoreductase, partial [Vibrio cholerae]
QIPLYVMNVTYPVIDTEVAEFCLDKDAVLIVEEGQPEYLEQAINTVLRRRDIQARVHGKDVLPMGGDYTAQVLLGGI